MKKTLMYYRSLPYRLHVSRFTDDEDGEAYYCASYAKLPHVKGVHRDRLVAIRLAKELFDSYIEAQLEWGQEIPEPDVPRYRRRGGMYKLRGPDPCSRSHGGEDAAPRIRDGSGFGIDGQATEKTRSSSVQPSHV